MRESASSASPRSISTALVAYSSRRPKSRWAVSRSKTETVAPPSESTEPNSTIPAIRNSCAGPPYEDVRTNAELIYERVSDGTMPCDSRWPAEQVERFRAWIDAGSPP